MGCQRSGPKPASGVEPDAVVELQKIGHGISRKEILRFAGELYSKKKMKVQKKSHAF
jgi:hypothetical protein